jgi:hydrogenase maturation protein HypF
MSELCKASIHITGIVQGVGFRPFVYGLATRFGLKGWVRNTSAGVDIEVDGVQSVLDEFIAALKSGLPPLARIDTFAVSFGPAGLFTTFDIFHSEAVAGAFQPISPDVCICADCLRELFDPNNRRYRYPFINCTNCGPRFTIITDIPYDRPKTTMAPFAMCPDCASEYQDPLDRRFHAQPVACPVCGPHVWLEESAKFHVPSSTLVPSAVEGSLATRHSSLAPRHSSDDAILQAQKLLRDGKILAVKGLGGFHLACDATNSQAVAELRNRKLRVDKPFALMMPDIETVEKHCFVSQAERELLESRQRPIVLLFRRPESNIASEVAPRQDTLGVMLPYTPLHYLLMADGGWQMVLVMTSGNLSEEPIATGNDEARERLVSLADAFLMHNRDIRTRCDDSVVRVVSNQSSVISDQSLNTEHWSLSTHPLRRSRGYAPDPIQLPFEAPPLLAVGPELKNTFCLTRERYAFLSHHIGDMENYETLRSFEDGVTHFERLFRIQPEAIAYDLHPNYLSTRYALQRAGQEDMPAFGVQHHHAHIAACMADNGLTGESPVIGVAFDGTGYGEDAAIWGGEFLVADYASYQRVVHLAYFPLPGGDAAIRRPARTALALLWKLGLDWDERFAPTQALSEEERMALRVQLERGLNAPQTSSMGRLFDAAAALAGVRQQVNYEAQAAIEFEALADLHETGKYPFVVGKPEIQPRPAFEALSADVLSGVPLPVISARFHNGLAEMVCEVCCQICSEVNESVIALSGGVWQNQLLLLRTMMRLQAEGFLVYIHRQVPVNDGGLSLGQAAVAVTRASRTSL